MKQLAARDFEDLLQVWMTIVTSTDVVYLTLYLCLFKCAIPVFEGLLPDPHNERLMDLLFIFGYWHGLAKLRQHTDVTLETMDRLTTALGEKFREFQQHTCSAFVTHELKKETNARKRRELKNTKNSTASTKRRSTRKVDSSGTEVGNQPLVAEQRVGSK